MVQQAAPAVTVHKLDGIIRAQVCSLDGGCVWSQVELHARVDDDHSWFVGYWDPADPTNNAQASGTGKCEADAVIRMLTAIASLAPARP